VHDFTPTTLKTLEEKTLFGNSNYIIKSQIFEVKSEKSKHVELNDLDIIEIFNECYETMDSLPKQVFVNNYKAL